MQAIAKVVEGGRLLLPAGIRRAMRLEKGDSVALELDGDTLTMRSNRAVIRDIQEMLRPYRNDRSVVDELIEERRREARMEEDGR